MIHTALRCVASVLGMMVIAFSWTALRHARDLARSWPEGEGQAEGTSSPNVNRLAYGAMLVAGAQTVVSQSLLLSSSSPVPWYGAPVIILWELLLLAWFVKRIRYHREREDA
jgi:hypothetical protein